MKQIFMMCICGFCAFTCNYVQADGINSDTLVVYSQKNKPLGLDNYQAGVYYHNGKNVYTLRGFNVASGNKITSFKVNPSGASYAILDEKKGKSAIRFFDLWKPKTELGKIESGEHAVTDFCFAADAKSVYVLTDNKKVHRYELKNLEAEEGFVITADGNQLCVSPNGYYLTLIDGNKVHVWNIDAQTLHTSITMDADVKHVAYSSNSALMAVLADDGRCYIYDTRTFEASYKYQALGTAEYCYFHPENKYLAVVTGSRRIAVMNILNERDRTYLNAPADSVRYLTFVNNRDNVSTLVYNTDSAIIFSPLPQLSPNRTQLLTERLNSRMEEWMTRMENETLDEYNARVNDETRMQQIRLFEMEIATEMAGDMLSMAQISLGSYNQEMQMLTLDFGNTMPSIYLSVPEDQLSDFMDPGVLQFKDTKYCVNESDEFEMVYTEVVNTKTGKTYIFDNTERRSLAFLEADDNFVPFDQLQTSKMEELKLTEIRNGVLNAAKSSKKISNHTKIDVRTKVLSATDATGKRISNYQVAVSYTVDQAFSAKEDFGAGKYVTEESNAAKAMLEVVKQALENDLAKYVVPGKQVKIRVTGMADASRIIKAIRYDGVYGDFEREPVYKDNILGNITVTRQTGIADNEQLAFLRAIGVKQYMLDNIPSLSGMNIKFEPCIDISKKAGSQYRRISVELTFIDAF